MLTMESVEPTINIWKCNGTVFLCSLLYEFIWKFSTKYWQRCVVKSCTCACIVKVCFYHHRPSFVTCLKFCALHSIINYNGWGEIYDFSEIKFKLLFIGNRSKWKSCVLTLSSMQRRVSMSVNAQCTLNTELWTELAQIFWHMLCAKDRTQSFHQMWINNRASESQVS